MEVVAEPADLTAHYQKLNETADSLRSLLTRDAAATVAAWDGRIMPLVDEFEQLFRRYLVEKDRGGFMKWVLEQRPTKAIEVRRLRRQAEGFVEELSALRSREQGGRIGLEALASRAGRLRALLDEVRVHHEEANGLVQHVFCQDIGFPS
jgi:hypothetical protein